MTRVVLLGGGYTSAWAYRAIARRRLLVRGLELTVVSPHAVHTFHGFTGEVLAGELPADATHSPLSEVFPRATHVRGTAVAVDPAGRTVTVATGGGELLLPFDQLVVGTGSREDTDAVPGLSEHGWRLREPEQTAALLDHLAGVPGPVVVVGGGLSGTEAAGALAARRDVVLLSPGAPAAQLGSLARRAAAELERSGVRVHPARAERVEPGRVVLSDGTVQPAAAVVAALGNRAAPVPGLPQVGGELRPDPTLSVAPGVWAAGDAARVPRRTGDDAPRDALWAIRAGTRVGRNVVRAARGRAPRRFTYRGLGSAAGFGRGRALVRLYGVPLTGAAAWLLRLGFFLWFVPSRQQALRLLAAYLRPAAVVAVPRSVATTALPTPRTPDVVAVPGLFGQSATVTVPDTVPAEVSAPAGTGEEPVPAGG